MIIGKDRNENYMKKVVFFHHNTVSVGAGLSALYILRSFPLELLNVVVCLPKGQGDLKQKISEQGIQVRCDFPKPYSYMHISGYHYKIWSLSHLHNIIDILKDIKIVKCILEEEKPELVFVNSMTLFWIGEIVKKYDKRIKLICFDRESYCHGSFGIRTYIIKKKLNTYFDKIVFLSDFDKRETGKEENKYIKITDKVDSKAYMGLEKNSCRKELSLPFEDKLILFVGGISKLKGTKTALEMIAYMQLDAKLIILQYEKPVILTNKIQKFRKYVRNKKGIEIDDWCDEYIKNNNLSKRLILRGRTTEVEKYFVACDLVIFPSTEPHQARPIFEAGIAKRPIIVSKFDNTKEFMDEKNGWTADYRDHLEWANLADKILDDDKEVKIRVEENYKSVILHNNIDTLKQEIGQLLKTFLNN